MQTFKKQERLCNKKDIDLVFSEGKHFYEFPFKVIILQKEKQSPYPVHLLISVPKRNIHGAVQRNLLKRRIREAYRKNKSELYETLAGENLRFDLALIYITKDIIDYKEIEAKINLILQRLKQDYKTYLNISS